MEYAKVLEKTKFEAIEKATTKISTSLPDWKADKDLLSQLLQL